MKKIETIICPQNWDSMRAELRTLGVSATLREVRVFGRTPPKREVYRGSPYTVDTTVELELTMLVRDELLESTISSLRRATGEADILVTPVEHVVRSGDAPRGREATAPRPVASLRPIAAPTLVAAAVRA